MTRNISLVFVGIFMCSGAIAAPAATCPTGYTPSLAPEKPGYGMDSRGRCVELCPVENMNILNTSAGFTANVFATKNTTPALVVGMVGATCYVDLVPNSSSGANAGINVLYNGVKYHAPAANACYETYRLTYDCGAGASGDEPESVDLHWGELFPTPYAGVNNSCRRPGYFLAGWDVNGTVSPVGGGAPYTYDSDNTATARWSPREYTGFYDCGVCTYGYTYQPSTAISKTLTTKFGDSTRIESITCANDDGLTIEGYGIYSPDGELGATVQPGQSFEWKFPYDAYIAPIYAESMVSRVSNATFSCGDGATGTAPAARRMRYGELIFAPTFFSDCKKTGYYIDGILADGNVGGSASAVGPYPAGRDTVATPNWVPIDYTVFYDCSNVQSGTVSTTQTAHYGDAVVASDVCGAGVTYRIGLGADTDTDTVTAGNTFLFKYTTNIVLTAIAG